tara:strand:+ start:457 stop:1140 length:684 start_codon:yes stop_codon:yes gene_type:complete
MINILALSIIVFGATAYFIDSLSLKIRITSGIVGKVAIFNHMSLIAMMFNRFSVALTLPVLGFLLDYGVNQDFLIMTILGAITLYLFLNIILIFFSYKISKTLISMLRFYDQKDTSQLNKELFKVNSFGFDLPSCFFYFIILLGFFLPSILASFFLEWRASIMQFGFTLNVLGTLINVLLIEKKVSLAIDGKDAKNVLDLSNRILIGRFIGAFLALITIFFILALKP